MSCPTLETIAAWTLDELDPEAGEQFEEHFFGCDACLRQAERMRRMVLELEASLPPILTPERRQALSVARPRLPSIDVKPGESATILLGGAAEVGFWVMHAPLAGAVRVDFEARDAGGAPIFALRDVPFDEARGEVVLACQVHYRALPVTTQMHVSLTAVDANGSRPLGEYTLNHVFESL